MNSEYVRIQDGCIQAVYRHSVTGEVRSQRKRRPKGVDPDHCTWMMPCDDHPREFANWCPRCKRLHPYLRLNLSIRCECGRLVDRTEQLAQRAAWNAYPNVPR